MRHLGYLLIVAGFLAGAYVAVRQVEAVPVAPFLAALAVGAVGVALVRVTLLREARHADRLAADLSTLESALSAITDNARKLDRDKETVDVYDLRHRIDALFPDDLVRFVEARQTLAHRYGLQAYADVMNPFSAGERYLNRVWSTSTDGYLDEAHEYIGRSHEQFEEALAQLRRLTGKGGRRGDMDPDDTTTLTGL